MTKQAFKKALQRDRERKAAERGERLVVKGYPYSHNPYLPHTPVEDCYSGCLNGKDT